MPLSMNIRTNGVNTFIALSGEICAESVGELAEVLQRCQCTHGRCFIATDAASGCEAEAKASLHQGLQHYGVERSALYFKGRYAFDLAPDGCRVLVVKPQAHKDAASGTESHRHRPGCTGNCACCPHCRGKQH